MNDIQFVETLKAVYHDNGRLLLSPEDTARLLKLAVAGASIDPNPKALPAFDAPKGKKMVWSESRKRVYALLLAETTRDGKRSCLSPTEIASRLNPDTERHSSWASPICLALTKAGYAERNANGHYRATGK